MFDKMNQKFFDPDERLDKICPKCGSNQISFLHFGFGWDDELQPLIDSGEIIPMGCIIGKENLACRVCEHSWASVNLLNDSENS